MAATSFAPSGPLNRQSSTFVAFSAKRLKLTPAPSHVAPRGYGRPGQTRMSFSVELYHIGAGGDAKLCHPLLTLIVRSAIIISQLPCQSRLATGSPTPHFMARLQNRLAREQ